MNKAKPFVDDVFREKSLSDVYRSSRQIGSTRFNTRVITASVFIAVIYVIANVWFGVENLRVVSAITRTTANMISVSTAVLGFLIAGFSIFISSTPISVLKSLKLTQYKDTDLSWFKQIMFNFLNVFTVYLVSMVSALAVNIVTPLDPPSFLVGVFPETWITACNSAILAALCVILVYMALRLKSFIWTMYQTLIASIELS